MNGREISLIKVLGKEFEVVTKKIADDFQQALEKATSSLEKQLEEIRHSIPEFQPVEIPNVSKVVAGTISEIELLRAPELSDPSQITTDAAESTVKQALESMPVPKGGKSVTVDDPRPLVKEAVNALIPEPVGVEELAQDLLSKVPVPEPGSDDRDTLAIGLESLINEEKSYPRGIYATHKGGLWHSHEETHGMRGWECIADGVSGIDTKQDNQQTFSASLERASGIVEVKSFDIPITIYRDVFRSDTGYQPGDTVTQGGCVWHCNEKTCGKPDETGSKEWALAVKKGRDLRGKP